MAQVESGFNNLYPEAVSLRLVGAIGLVGAGTGVTLGRHLGKKEEVVL